MLNLFNMHSGYLISLTVIFGLVIGSFLNVVIYRLPIMLQREWQSQCQEFLKLPIAASTTRWNLILPGSHCPHCQRAIAIYWNIPIISYLLLRGRCRHCQQTIAWRYPAVELLAGLLAAIAVLHFGYSWQALAVMCFSWILLTLTFIDLEQQLLPDVLTLSLLWLGLLCNMGQWFTSINSAILGAVIGYLSLWLVAKLFQQATGKIGMGQGDLKLFAALGAWLGWQLLPFVLLAAATVGSVVTLILIISKRRPRDATIPFGPYLALAGWFAMLWGNPLLTWYLGK